MGAKVKLSHMLSSIARANLYSPNMCQSMSISHALRLRLAGGRSFNAAYSTSCVKSSAHVVNQRSICATYYRGGTSRGVIFAKDDLPQDTKQWPRVFLRLMGSPDPNGRQLNGLGAGVSSLSKICVIACSPREDADVDYTFFAIGIDNEEVDDSGNCGNMSSAVGPYAVEQGLAIPISLRGEAEQLVRIHNTNTGKIIHSRFPLLNGAPQVTGGYQVDGVGGAGAPISLDFVNPAGSKTGKLLPTGKAVNIICGTPVSCVDAANPVVFVKAEDLGIDATLLPDKLSVQPGLLERLENLRQHGAVAMGVASHLSATPRAIPKIGIVARAGKAHVSLNGLAVEDIDLVVRMTSDRLFHRAIPLTGALCTAVAAQVEGSVVQDCLDTNCLVKSTLVIGHPSGRIQVSAAKDEDGQIQSATVYRTARRIMDGKFYWTDTDSNV